MPSRITAHGIEAQAMRHNGALIYELTSPAGKEGYARQTDRRCWEHYADEDALMRGARYGSAPRLDTLMLGIGDSVRRGISVAQINQLPENKARNERAERPERITLTLTTESLMNQQQQAMAQIANQQRYMAGTKAESLKSVAKMTIEGIAPVAGLPKYQPIPWDQVPGYNPVPFDEAVAARCGDGGSGG